MVTPTGTEDATQSALIIVCPEAERAVRQHRLRYDSSAQRGVPAHVTVTFPFIPSPGPAPDDDEHLARLLSGFAPFTLRGSETDWFDDRVLFVALDVPAPVIALTSAVTRAFPEHPPYGGAFDEVTPHLTIGHGHPPNLLAQAEADVHQRLPFEQHVDCVELWAGPSTQGPILSDSWRRVRSYRLRAPGAVPPSRRTP